LALAVAETKSATAAMGLLGEGSLNIGSGGRRNTQLHEFGEVPGCASRSGFASAANS
jgi:hypothetical protein